MKQLTKALTFFLLIAIFHLFIYFSGAIPFFDFRFFDIISSYKTTPFTPSSSSTIVVEIDEESLQRFGQWPWSRILVAKVLQEILRQRPAAVGFDIFFPEPDRTSPLQIKTFYKKMLGF
ncbi:MAG: CHASE2 domain-containing protein, partial [Deltaproteobacteria bacterium]|nr:CHASE2 domain-containing protein [Deltaproteobacteria bacterium]